MDNKVKRYYHLKQKHKEIEQELSELRNDITAYCAVQGVTELEIGSHRVKIVFQDRKEYDDNKLYETLADPGLWRLLSKPDSSKISSLIKLNVISDERIKDTYSVKTITLLHVEKK
ncbi:hypothetical protein ACFQZT_00675 [Paenibacillus sp. GCM10027628]|uniref:hypothetical protein n=1 Tax=Paenibacillus sp. GCM10027628 TaxID=3273413 RepID=UPI00362B5D61